jgi:hypothetical protein
MFIFHKHEGGWEANIENDNTGSHTMLDSDEEKTAVELLSVIDKAFIRAYLKKVLSQAVLRSLFLDE